MIFNFTIRVTIELLTCIDKRLYTGTINIRNSAEIIDNSAKERTIVIFTHMKKLVHTSRNEPLIPGSITKFLVLSRTTPTSLFFGVIDDTIIDHAGIGECK